MLIALCDDESFENDNLYKLINDYAIRYDHDIHCEVFTSGAALLKSDRKFDMYFLDYQMDEMNGLELAGKLRNEKNDLAAIVFLTSYREIVYDCFDVNTYRFLVKPITEPVLTKVLDDFMKTSILFSRISLKKDGMTESINTKEIYYIESFKKECTVHMRDGEKTYTCRLYEIKENLHPEFFFQPHRSFVVNLYYVLKDDGKTITMTNGAEIPISKYAAKEYRTARDRFLLKYGN